MIIGALVAVAGLAWLIALRARFSAATVLLFALSLRVVLLLVPFHSDDVYRYVWEGRIQNAGFSPFAYAPDDERLAGLRRASHENINHPDLPTIYPPLAQALFRTATAAGLEELGMAKLLMVLEMGVVLLLFLWLRSPAVMVYAWAPLAMAGPLGGHVDPLMLLFLVGCAWAWERRRLHAAAALLGCAVLSKAVALVLLPWLLVRKPRVALTALIVIAVGYLPYGFSLGSLVTFASEFRFNGSMHHLFGNFSLVLLAAWIAWVTLTQPRLPAAAALIFAGLLLLSPTVHFWYLSWFLVFLPAVTARWREPLLLWCITIAATCATYALAPPFREYFLLTALEYGFPFLFGGWLLWRHWPRRGPLRAPTPGPLPRFGVVIPCRGEAENLRALLPQWSGSEAERVIVADTPTGDGTEELCASFQNVTYLAVPVRGYGAAVRAGLDGLGELDGVGLAVVCDADHARGPEQVASLLQPFEDPRVGLVTSARTNTLPKAQRHGNALATFLIGLGWGRRFHDLGPFRALRLPFPELHDRGFGWNVEMNVRALERGLEVVEVALPGSEREHGQDQISGTAHGIVAAGVGILRQLYRLREQSCRRPL